MRTYSREFTAYAAEHGRSPSEQLDFDKEAHPGGCMCGFILWVSNRMEELRRDRPSLFIGGNIRNHAAKNEYFESFSTLEHAVSE